MNWSDLLDWDEYIKLLIGLLALADPIGNLPVISTLAKQFSYSDKEIIARASAITFIVFMIVFSLFGAHILNLFGITIAALKISGGIIFIFYALEMLGIITFAESPEIKTAKDARIVGIVPIGIPLLVGPGTISKIIIYSDLHNSLAHQILIFTAVLTVGLIIYLSFRASLIMGAGIGATTTRIITKVMGLLLSGIAVEFILEGVVEFLP